MNPNVIAGLINRAYNGFDMFSFENRLKLQKFTYFLEHGFGLNIGYEFNWFTYGPYCMELTKDGFMADFKNTPELKFSDQDSESRFMNFLEFLKSRKDDTEWLEIASSIHFLKKLDPTRTEEKIVGLVMNNREEFKNKEKKIKDILEELKSLGIYNG